MKKLIVLIAALVIFVSGYTQSYHAFKWIGAGVPDTIVVGGEVRLLKTGAAAPYWEWQAKENFATTDLNAVKVEVANLKPCSCNGAIRTTGFNDKGQTNTFTRYSLKSSLGSTDVKGTENGWCKGDGTMVHSARCDNPTQTKEGVVFTAPQTSNTRVGNPSVSVASPAGGGDINIHIDIENNSNSGGAQAQPAAPVYDEYYSYGGQQWPVVGYYGDYQVAMVQDYQCIVYGGNPYTMVGGYCYQPSCGNGGWGWRLLGNFVQCFGQVLGNNFCQFYTGGDGHCSNGNNGGINVTNYTNYYVNNTTNNTYNYNNGTGQNGGPSNGNTGGIGPGSVPNTNPGNTGGVGGNTNPNGNVNGFGKQTARADGKATIRNGSDAQSAYAGKTAIKSGNYQPSYNNGGKATIRNSYAQPSYNRAPAQQRSAPAYRSR